MATCSSSPSSHLLYNNLRPVFVKKSSQNRLSVNCPPAGYQHDKLHITARQKTAHKQQTVSWQMLKRLLTHGRQVSSGAVPYNLLSILTTDNQENVACSITFTHLIILHVSCFVFETLESSCYIHLQSDHVLYLCRFISPCLINTALQWASNFSTAASETYCRSNACWQLTDKLHVLTSYI